MLSWALGWYSPFSSFKESVCVSSFSSSKKKDPFPEWESKQCGSRRICPKAQPTQLRSKIPLRPFLAVANFSLLATWGIGKSLSALFACSRITTPAKPCPAGGDYSSKDFHKKVWGVFPSSINCRMKSKSKSLKTSLKKLHRWWIFNQRIRERHDHQHHKIWEGHQVWHSKSLRLVCKAHCVGDRDISKSSDSSGFGMVDMAKKGQHMSQ